MKRPSEPLVAALIVLCIVLALTYVLSTRDYRVNAAKQTGSRVKREVDHEARDRIFYHETSGRGFLTWSQLCSVESAASLNPNRPVQVIMSAEHVDESHPWMRVVERLRNIHLVQIDNEQYFKGSPLEHWYNRAEWQFAEFEISHMAHYIRMVTLLRGGGLYMDLDVLLLKGLGAAFRDFFVFSSKSNRKVNSAVFHLSKDHAVIKRMIEILSAVYDPSKEILHGSQAATDALRSHCGKNLTPAKCPDVRLLPHFYFYPFTWSEWANMLEDAGETLLTNATAGHGVHTHHDFLYFENYVDLESNQLYAHLARKHCPLTVEQATIHNKATM